MKYLLSALLFISTALLSAQSHQKRLALVIGNADYKIAARLDDPLKNIDSLENILQSIGFTVLKYKNLNQREMKIAINDFTEQLKNYHTAFFYYAGHALGLNNENYLVPLGARLERELDIPLECVSFNRLIGDISTAELKTNILVLDAYQPDAFNYLKKNPDEKGLALIDSPGKFYIAFSSRPRESSFDNQRVTSLYSEELIKNIGTKDIQIEDVFKAVRRNIYAITKGQQMPWETSAGVYFRFNPVEK